ncbi:DUF3347 domain-containing protein [Sediminicola sp. 1XM1-17]|uniref:DUF3347 domain-containing protein n=1 Tax=Sediminicola sp. 1XM1-17 TaxID=3127702 RepID=UPI003076CE4A
MKYNMLKKKKQSNYAIFAGLTLLVMTACGEEKKKEPITPEASAVTEIKEDATAMVSFKDDATGKIFNGYLAIKTALTKTDVEGTKTAAKKLAENLDENEMEFKGVAQEMANSEDIGKQRELFATLTSKAEQLFKDQLAQGTIYKQFCPMAFNNTGGYWFSEVSEIRNPYYGDMMLTCGAVKETIQ